MGSLLPHLKGLQSSPVAYQQAYFTDMFIRERWRYPESTPRVCYTFNLSFGPVLGSAEPTFLAYTTADFSGFFKFFLQKCHSKKQNYKANIQDQCFIIMTYHSKLSFGCNNKTKTQKQTKPERCWSYSGFRRKSALYKQPHGIKTKKKI